MNTEEKLKIIHENPHVWSIGDGFRTKKGVTTEEKCTVVLVEYPSVTRILRLARWGVGLIIGTEK